MPDSSGTATAFLSGIKTNMGLVGVNSEVRRGNCDDVTDRSLVKSVLRQSLDDGIAAKLHEVQRSVPIVNIGTNEN